MAEGSPLVSVITATRNRPELVAVALRKLLSGPRPYREKVESSAAS
jgi:hypothetical protein